MNFYEIEFLAKERRQRIEDELRKIHLLQAVQIGKFSWPKNWILRLADLLIGTGLHLKGYYRTTCGKHSTLFSN